MNLLHDALRNLSALAELKSEGGILDQDHLIGASSLEGIRTSLQLGYVGGILEV